MKIIVDENLSPEVADIFRNSGLEASHINELKSHSKQRVLDDQLRRLTIQKGYIIITKDDDFVKSYVNRKVPQKLIYIFGLDKKELLLQRMKEVAPDLENLLLNHDFIEINESEIRFPLPD